MFCQYLNPKPISISLSPNTEKDDILLAFKLLWKPWRWKFSVNQRNNQRQSASTILEEEFKKYLGVKYAISFNSGRSALMAILAALFGEQASSEALAKEDEEVLLQAFTCNAVPNPVIWSRLREAEARYGEAKARLREAEARYGEAKARLRDDASARQAGLKPIYVDCNENTFNIDPEDLRRKITSNSRAVIVQHTFGLPAEMDEIIKICQAHNLILIEDCAHSLGATYKGKKIGTFGRVSFFSFSRDKVISSVYGGMVVTSDDELAKKIKEYQERIGYPSYFWILQQLLHPVLMNWLILPTYKYFGKYLLILFQWLHIFSKAVHWKEKRGQKPCYFPKRLPDALAILAQNQFRKLEKFNRHRREIAEFYNRELADTSYQLPVTSDGDIFLRYAIKHPNAHQIIQKAWSHNLLVGDWYTTPIAPHDTKLEKMQYTLGSCPNAEKLAKITLNLPTHINISVKDAQKIVDFLKKISKNNKDHNTISTAVEKVL
ncbi:MAG: DegT/DnrJ/EryC1/StrS family aminotransferase [Candidatus Pacebacteria bacterium]|nr:DegT/DnrJ/EryC1/StrS family aminotransferase [Candidatus Paceibacterota bacterium]